MRKIWLTRHGNREDFIDETWRERSERPFDPRLSADGREQASALGRRMRDTSLEIIYSSPFLRTIETADLIAREFGCAVRVESGLSEWLNAEWFDTAPDWLPLPELALRFPSLDLSWTPLVHPSFPEDAEQAFDRAARAARALVAAEPRPFMMIAHGHSMSGAARGLAPDASGLHCGLCALVELWQAEPSADWTMHLKGCERHSQAPAESLRFN